MNTRQWLSDFAAAKRKKAIPVLSFPSITMLGITVKELTSDSDLQAKGMKAIADRVPSGASVSMMDLSLEAQAFGCEIHISEDEIPTVISSIVESEDDAKKLRVPKVGEGRTGLYVEAIEKTLKLITDRPVFAGIIGPFSLAGRLMDVTQALVNCYAEPDMVHITMEKCTEFLIEYAQAYKNTGCAGIVMAEPLTGLLSPDLAVEFSEPYVKRIVDAVQDDDFIVIYHNCGNNTIQQIDSIAAVGASAYHFGNSIDMEELLSKAPSDMIAMGNISPSAEFLNGTPESVRKATLNLMERCCEKYPNFVISSGCDIPPKSSWDNIEAFFSAVDEYYTSKGV